VPHFSVPHFPVSHFQRPPWRYKGNDRRSIDVVFATLTVLMSRSRWIGKHGQSSVLPVDCRRQWVGGWRSTLNLISRVVVSPVRGTRPEVSMTFCPPDLASAVTVNLQQYR